MVKSPPCNTGYTGLIPNCRLKIPHAMRHSLASGLLEENVPISDISGILGHANTLTTETYLSVDTTHLKELSLEVPYEKE